MEHRETIKPFWMKFYGRFFDKHEIKILLSEDRDYVFFYIAMLLESMAHAGYVRFNEKRSYSAHMLSLLLNMPEEKVVLSIKKLEELDLLVLEDDGTMFLPAAPAMCGCGSDSAERMRKLREKRKNENISDLGTTQVRTGANKCEQVVTSDGSIEYRDKRLKNKNIYSSPFPPPKGGGDDAGDFDSVKNKGSDEFDHVTREDVSNYFKRMREYKGKDASAEVEEELWEYLVSTDFKKGDGMPIVKSNLHSTISRWINNRNKESRAEETKKREELEKKESERLREERLNRMRLTPVAPEDEL